jgi:uncharacterized protein with HEPN domain
MSFEPHDYLRHIQVETDYLIAQSTGLSLEEFLRDETLRRAFVRSLEVIGEATKRVPNDFPFAAPYGRVARHGGNARPAHPRYFGIDYELVWDVVLHRIPSPPPAVVELFSSGMQYPYLR